MAPATKNVFLINFHEVYPSSPGALNKLMCEKHIEVLEGLGHTVKTTVLADGYDIDEEIEKHIWADVVIMQGPLYWMGIPGAFKKYQDVVLTAGGDGRLAWNDGRTRADPNKGYGTGGVLQGKKFMICLTASAPKRSFGSGTDQWFFQKRTIDDVLIPIHSTYRFLGMEPLPTFTCHDVKEAPDVPAYLSGLEAHLTANISREEPYAITYTKTEPLATAPFESQTPKNVLVINCHTVTQMSPGALNATLAALAAKVCRDNGHTVKTTHVEDDYDIDAEIEKHMWADVVIMQGPLYWMGMTWAFKKYQDEVLTAGMDGRLAWNDGRTRADPNMGYGTGGVLQGKKYMISLTANVPKRSFGDGPDQYLFQGQRFDDLFFPVHLTYRFLGMEPLPTFTCHDVMKAPTIESDLVRFESHLNEHIPAPKSDL